MSIEVNHLGMTLELHEREIENNDVLSILRGARISPAMLRCLRSCSLSADHRLSVVRKSEGALDAGGRTRARSTPIPRCIMRSSLRSSRHVPYLVLLVELDAQRGRPTRARGVAGDREFDNARRRAGAETSCTDRGYRFARADGVYRHCAGAEFAAVDARPRSATAAAAMALSVHGIPNLDAYCAFRPVALTTAVHLSRSLRISSVTLAGEPGNSS